MSSLKEYLHTDWAAMTLNDWIGTIITVGAFLAILGMTIHVFRPSNKERFESQRNIPIDDERLGTEDRE